MSVFVNFFSCVLSRGESQLLVRVASVAQMFLKTVSVAILQWL